MARHPYTGSTQASEALLDHIQPDITELYLSAAEVTAGSAAFANLDARFDDIESDITGLGSANLPGQGGNAGNFLMTNGTTATWTAQATTELSDDTSPVLGATLECSTYGINMADQVLSRAKLVDTSATVNALGDLGGGTDDIDLTSGNIVTATVSTGTQTISFSNPAATGSYCDFVLLLTNGGSQTVVWDGTASGGVDWPSGNAPDLTASGIDAIVFWTIDAGTTWYGKLIDVGFA